MTRLDRPTIVAAALDLIDEDGLDFTLRALGDRLGVSPMAPYRHFEDKSAIIDAVADSVMASVRLTDPASVTDPDEIILGYARRARQTLLAHPALVPVVAARPLVRTSPVEDLLVLYEAFRGAGFPDDAIPGAALSMFAITVGLVLHEQQRAAYDRTQGASYEQDRRTILAEVLEQVDAPSSGEELMRAVVDDDWGTQLFEQTLADCYDGLRRRAGIL